MREHDDEIARLRAELVRTEPDSEQDYHVRPELALLLIRRFEDLAEQGAGADTGDLLEVLQHAHHMLRWCERGSDDWQDVVELRVVAHQNLYESLTDPRDLEEAIAGQRALVRWTSQVHHVVKLAELLIARYSAAPVDECADLLEAAALLRSETAEELSDPDRIEVWYRLGLYLAEILRWNRDFGTRTAEQATEVLDVLARTFTLLDHDDPRLGEVLLETARAHAARSDLDGADTDADRDEAIAGFRGLASTDTRAASGLAAALSERYDVHADPVDRDEAITVFQGLRGRSDLEMSRADLAMLLGDLLLDRAKEKPDEVESLLRYLEDVFHEAGATDPLLGTLLLEACFLWRSASVAELTRVISLMDALMTEHPAGTPVHLALLPMLASAQTARALRSTAAQDLVVAEESLRVASRDVQPYDWTHLLLLGLLGAVVVVRHGGDVTRWPNPIHLARDFPPERRAEVLGLLEEHRHGELAGHPDLLCAVALLRANSTATFDDGFIAEQAAYRRETIRLLEAARAALPEGDELDVALTQQSAHQYSELGRMLESTPDIGQALTLFADLLGRIDDGHPLHATTTSLYALTVMVARLHGDAVVDVRVARTAFTRAADAHGIEAPTRVMYLRALGMIEAMLWAEDSTTGDLSAAVNHFKKALSLLAEDDPEHDVLRHDLALALVDRHRASGELHDLETAAAHLHALVPIVRARGDRSAVDEASLLESIHQVEVERSIARLTGADHDPDAVLAGLKARLSEAESRMAAGEHVDTYVVAVLRSTIGAALMKKAEADEDPAVLAEAADFLRATAAGMKPGSAQQAKAVVAARVSSAIVNAARADRPSFEADVLAVMEVWRDRGQSDLVREQAACTVVGAWLAWHARTRESAALDTALALFDEVVAFGGEEHERGNTSLLLDQLTDACWKRGHSADVDRAVDLSFRSLRARAREVLLQTASEYRLHQAKGAAGRALAVVDRCLAAGSPVRAVEAVEWGRGLVLAATTATSDVAALLREGGHDELAEEWDRSESTRTFAPLPDAVVPVDFVPDDLRYRVLSALSGALRDRRLLAPPSVSALAIALLRSDSDVLVHLVPGRALLVTSHKRVFEVPLPLLPASAPTGLAVQELCEWAWQVAMAPLLSRLRELGVGAGSPRVVLVPSGELGAVPWHAARDGERVAVREAVFSYAASGRQFCELADRTRTPLDQSPVVVNDPTGDLPAAMLDAEFLHSRLPDGRFYGVELDGVPHSGDGTPDDVLKAFADASLLHLGCHAESGVTLARSFLRLTSTLTVDRILEQARGRAVNAPGGLVVVAACQSDLSGADHDEALTLASAFVAAGAASVVGTKWEVHDIGASILICVFYTELLGRNPRPRDALRATQLWALDPDRVVPEGMPPFLASRAKRLDLAHPSFWAAFTHQGW